MVNQEALVQPMFRTTATLAPTPEYDWRSIGRVDRQLTSEEFLELKDIAMDIAGVLQLRRLDDLQRTPHTMLCLEYHSVEDEEQAMALADRFTALANKALSQVVPTFSHQRDLVTS